MRLKFIEYIINAACCECRCDARSGSLVYRDLHEILKSEAREKRNNNRLKISQDEISRCFLRARRFYLTDRLIIYFTKIFTRVRIKRERLNLQNNVKVRLDYSHEEGILCIRDVTFSMETN